MATVDQGQVLTQADLTSGWRELALDWTQQILTVFQWPDANCNVLAALQTRLIVRRW
jgi:hypothetical protein